MNTLKRIFLRIMYSTIFLFSIFSIVQIRYFIYTEGLPLCNLDICKGTFNFLFFQSPELLHTDFINIKLLLFVFTASMSLVMLFTDYYYHHELNIEERIDKKTREELEKEMNAKERKSGKAKPDRLHDLTDRIKKILEDVSSKIKKK